ncbi:hypothetical protein C8J57DRAFT_1280412 [Mycena rebaudengoi]|nr:hypothetical protein C8J57DRAFT_1280412 [Mycena rebaudengoi]
MPKGREANRGRYVSLACNICRARKTKCDGVQPSCGSCISSGRGEECSWGRDTSHRKPRTEAHFEALRKRSDALQAYVTVLEGMLAKCVCQDVSGYHQFRPHLEVEAGGKDTDPLDSEDEAPDPEEEMAQVLTRPMKFLQLDDKLGGLLRYGIGVPPRLAGSLSSESSRSADNPNASYVLLVDGVDDSSCDLSFDWSRHLPPEVPLDRKEHDKMLDLFFKFFSIFSLRVVPSLFLTDMYRALRVPSWQPPPKTPNYSPMLHNAILAVASVFSDDPRIRNANRRKYFVVAATACLEAECEKPTVSLVHSLSLLGTYFSTSEDLKILGDGYFAMSARVGLSLGLGIDSSAWVKSGIIASDEMIGRNYAHWMLFALDACSSLYYCKEFLLLPECRDTPLPVVTPEADQLPWHYPPANIPPQPNYLSLIFAASTSLFLISRKIICLIDGLGRRDSSQQFILNDQAVTHIDLELNSWKSQLSPEIDITLANRAKSTPQKLTLHCLYHWCCILLHRPFFNRRARRILVSDREIDHTKLCRRSAESILELLETWSKLYSLRYNPGVLGPVAFSAGSIFLLLSLQAAVGVRLAFQTHKKSLSQAELCVAYLREMGKSWGSNSRAADMLQGFLDTKLKPIIARRSSPSILVSPENTASLETGAGESGDAWNSYQPQGNIDEIMGEMPWPQESWTFFDGELNGLFSSSSFAPPMLFPGADTLDMPQILPTTLESFYSTLESENWEQYMLSSDGSGGVLPRGTL